MAVPVAAAARAEPRVQVVPVGTAASIAIAQETAVMADEVAMADAEDTARAEAAVGPGAFSGKTPRLPFPRRNMSWAKAELRASVTATTDRKAPKPTKWNSKVFPLQPVPPP